MQYLVKTLLCDLLYAVGNRQLITASLCFVLLEQADVDLSSMSVTGSRPCFGVEDLCEMWEA